MERELYTDGGRQRRWFCGRRRAAWVKHATACVERVVGTPGATHADLRALPMAVLYARAADGFPTAPPRERTLRCLLLEWAGCPAACLRCLPHTTRWLIARILSLALPRRRIAAAAARLSMFLPPPPADDHDEAAAFRARPLTELCERWWNEDDKNRHRRSDTRLWKAVAAVHSGGVVVGGGGGVHRLRDAAKRQRDGRYASHLHAVRESTMERHPALWTFPVLLARTLERYAVPPDDAAHYVALAVAIAEARVCAAPCHRLPDRVRRAVACDVATLVVCLCDRAPQVSLRQLLPVGATTLHHIQECAAYIQARLHARQHAAAIVRPRGRYLHAVTAHPHTPVVCTLRGAVRLGVFEPAVRRSDAACIGGGAERRRMLACMRALEERDATRWRAHPPAPDAVPVRPVRPLEDGEVAALLRAARALPSARHEVVLLLLYTLALRAGAVGGMRFRDVDGDGSCWTITEKFSERRRVRPCAELRAAMRRYVAERGGGGDHFLFSDPWTPERRPRHVVASMLRTLCRRAGVRRIHPHEFRRHLVSLFVRHGNSVDQAAKFLGHRSSATTYKHYWLVEADTLADSMPFLRLLDGPPDAPPEPQAEEDDGDEQQRLRLQIAALEDRLRRLQGREEAERGATQPPVDNDDNAEDVPNPFQW